MSTNRGPAWLLKAGTAAVLALLLTTTAIPQTAFADPPATPQTEAPTTGISTGTGTESTGAESNAAESTETRSNETGSNETGSNETGSNTDGSASDEALEQNIAFENQPSDPTDTVEPEKLGPDSPEALAAKTVIPPSEPDYSSAAELAVSLSFPLYGSGEAFGQKSHPDSFTGGGALDRPRVHESYQEARDRALELTTNTGNISMPQDDRYWANCSAFTATVINNTVDPSFPSNLTFNQWHYVTKPQNGWKKVGTTANYRPQDYEPGDIFLTRPLILKNGNRSGHTFMWVGDYGGLKEVVAEASFGSEGSKSARMPALHVNTLKTEKDSSGRSYDVWRFVGKPEPTANTDVPGTIDWNSDGRADLVEVRDDGRLYVNLGNGEGDFVAHKQLGGSGWKNMHIATVGDVNGDRYMDLVALNKRDGKLYFYPGAKNGLFGTRSLLGSGFNSIRDLVSPGDIDGDGIADLVGIGASNNKLYSWTLNEHGKIASKREHYSGWKGWSLTGGSDVLGNGMTSLIARSPSGELFAYPSNPRSAGFPSTSRKLISKSNWSSYSVTSVGDVSGDGRADVIARDRAGKLWLYPGKGEGKLGKRLQIA